jgi:hypothetical protein
MAGLGTVSLAVFVGSAVVVALIERSPPPPPTSKSPPLPPRMMLHSTPFRALGITNPTAVAAEAVTSRDDEEVIGVVHDGKARAYFLNAMKGIGKHVVNDLLAGKPISVTYCDQTQCSRVLTDPASTKPLPLNLGGYSKGQMLLETGNKYFFQPTGECSDPTHPKPFPFTDHASTRTTWKAWRDRHPDTDAYLGGLPLAPQPKTARNESSSGP